MDIVFRATESGCAWYVWSPAVADLYPFTSEEAARCFARLDATASTQAHAKCFVMQCSLEQAATLI